MSKTKPKKPSKKPPKDTKRSWKGEALNRGKKGAGNQVESSGNVASEESKKAISYHEESWCAELHDSKYVFFADGKRAFDMPVKIAGNIKEGV